MKQLQRLPVDTTHVIQDAQRLTPTYTKPLKQIFGDRFIAVYQEVKEYELEQYRKVISSWEREYLLLNV